MGDCTIKGDGCPWFTTAGCTFTDPCHYKAQEKVVEDNKGEYKWVNFRCPRCQSCFLFLDKSNRITCSICGAFSSPIEKKDGKKWILFNSSSSSS